MTCGCFHDAIPGYFVLRYVHAAFARAPLRRAAIAYRQTTRFAAAWLHDKTYFAPRGSRRSEEHTSELQSLMLISFAVFCLEKKTKDTNTLTYNLIHISHVTS